MSTLKVDTIKSDTTPTVNITDGLSVSGVTTSTGKINCLDVIDIDANNKALRIGSAQNLQLTYTGSAAEITNIDASTPINIKVRDGAETAAAFKANGAVDLYHNNVKMFETTSTGVKIPIATAGHGITVDAGSNNIYPQFTFNANRSAENNSCGYLRAQWNGTDIAAIDFVAGADTTNKDDGHIRFQTRPSGSGMSERMRITSSGQALIGAGAIATPKASVGGLDVASGLYSIIMGGEANTGDGTPRANSAQKEARLGIPHYTNAEEPFGLVYGVAISGENRLNLGGGSSIVNAATSIKFYTAANTTTTAGTERLQITSSGEIDIAGRSFTMGTQSDSGASVGITGNAWSNNEIGIKMSHKVTGGQSFFVFYNNNGQVGYIQSSGSGTIYNTGSDYRLKENQVLISDGITRLKQLKPYRFNFKKDPSTTLDGFFAHEVQSVVPESIAGTKDEVATKDEGDRKKGDPILQGMDYGRITPLLTAALQEAIAKIEVLETKVAALESA